MVQLSGSCISGNSGSGTSTGGTTAPKVVAQIKPNFDSRYYADIYPDLYAAFGYDHDALWNHYDTTGRAEGRLYFMK